VSGNPTSDAAGQREHWQTTYQAHPGMYGQAPSRAAQHAIDLFRASDVRRVVELGAGQGRDTIPLLQAGLSVRALDFSATALGESRERADRCGLGERLVTDEHDVRHPLPLADASVDAVYAHMLLCMALTTTQLDTLLGEIRRVLRPGGWLVYTVRHVGDAHYGAGVPRGEGMFEHGGFIVHFFDQDLVERLATGMRLREVFEFAEGELPRRLWCVTQQQPVPPE
jgi:SAM-dependent methyltransferase